MFIPMMGIKKFVQMCDVIVGTYNYDVTSVDVIPILTDVIFLRLLPIIGLSESERTLT